MEVNNAESVLYIKICSLEKLKCNCLSLMVRQASQVIVLKLLFETVHSLTGLLSALSYSVGIWMTLFFSAFCLC